jgi:hypothetical protein
VSEHLEVIDDAEAALLQNVSKKAEDEKQPAKLPEPA